MYFGINTFLFKSPFVTESVALFPKFKAWGFDSVEIPLEEVAHIDPKTIKKALDDNGLACHSMCAALGPGRDLRGTKQEQQHAIDYLKGVMDTMPEVGASMLVGPLYSSVGRAEATGENEYKRQWETVVEHLKMLAVYAEQLHVKLAIEPLNRYETDFINTCEQALNLADDVGSNAITLLLDTYHMNIEEKFTPKAIVKAGSRLGHFHACGVDRGTPGNDHTNWPEIVAALREIKYDGGVVIESFTTDVKVIAKAASIWRKFEPSQEDIAVKGLQFLHSCFK